MSMADVFPLVMPAEFTVVYVVLVTSKIERSFGRRTYF